ncbi:ATP-grasp fold amidoligase family protein [Kytococcus sedentarius]|uniref:ATP-grasp fold amidoligase family protein n=1 Tax=Kytococcus sedentarius TaxID=1276 RepID=UPI00387A789A
MTKLFEVRRYSYRLKMLGNPPHPRPLVADKLRTMALGASYGIGVPTVYALWEHPEEIDLSGLPETFVVKANRGAGSMAVLPLRRVPGTTDRFELTDATARQLTAEEVVRHLTEGERRSGPWYAEQMLVADTPGDQLPPDYKLYCFYGEVGAGFARRVPAHFGSPGWQEQIRFHYFDGEGTTYRWRDERADDSIPLSPLMPELLGAGRVLAKAVPLPFVRVDLYATTAGVVVGELTLGPGGDQYLRAEEDARLGRMWERAQVRLEMDLASGARPYGMVAGDHPVPELLRPFLP